MANPNYGPQKFDGQFSEYLSPANIARPPAESPPPATGYEGTGGSIALLASKLFSGIGQGRMMSALAAEKEKDQRMQRFISWGDSIMQNPNITNEAKQQFGTDFQHALLTEGTGAIDHASKGAGKDNPIIGGLKHIVTGMAGGDVIKSKYDLKSVEDVINKYHDLPTNPAYDVTQLTNSALGNIQTEVNRLTQTNGGVAPSPEEVQASPVYQQNWRTLQRYAGKNADDLVKPYLAQPKSGTAARDTAVAQQRVNLEQQGQPPAPSAAGVVPTTAVPAQPQANRLSAAQLALMSTRPTSMETPRVALVDGQPKEVMRWKGGQGIPAGDFIKDDQGQFSIRTAGNIREYKEPAAGSIEEERVRATQALDQKRKLDTDHPPEARGELPPELRVPTASPEELQYLKAYGLISAPQFVKVDGKSTQVQHTFGGNGIPSGFINPSTGKYIDAGRIERDKNTNDTYRPAIDEKGKYGTKGGRYFVDETGKPLKDPQGDIVRPPDSQVSTVQKQLRTELTKQYVQFVATDKALSKEQFDKIQSLETAQIMDGTVRRNLTQQEKEQRQKQIVQSITERRQQNKTQTDTLMKTTAGAYGMPVNPFLEPDQLADVDEDSAPPTQSTRESSNWKAK